MLEDIKMLILEDEPIIGFVLEDMLEEIGCSAVLLATRLEEARQIIESNRVDAAILDINIHGQRSYPVAAELARKRLPFIFASGYGDSEHPEELRSVPTVTKPYSIDDIRKALQVALELSASPR